MTCGIGEGEDVFHKRLRQLDKSGRAPPDGPQSRHQTLGQEVQPRSPRHHLRRCLPFFQQVVHADNKKTSGLEFFCKLADELIDNNEGIHMTRAAA